MKVQREKGKKEQFLRPIVVKKKTVMRYQIMAVIPSNVKIPPESLKSNSIFTCPYAEMSTVTTSSKLKLSSIP